MNSDYKFIVVSEFPLKNKINTKSRKINEELHNDVIKEI